MADTQAKAEAWLGARGIQYCPSDVASLKALLDETRAIEQGYWINKYGSHEQERQGRLKAEARIRELEAEVQFFRSKFNQVAADWDECVNRARKAEAAVQRKDAGLRSVMSSETAWAKLAGESAERIKLLEAEVKRKDEALRRLPLWLGTVQSVTQGMEARCRKDQPHNHAHLRAMQTLLKEMGEVHDAALSPVSSPEQERVREAAAAGGSYSKWPLYAPEPSPAPSEPEEVCECGHDKQRHTYDGEGRPRTGWCTCTCMVFRLAPATQENAGHPFEPCSRNPGAGGCHYVQAGTSRERFCGRPRSEHPVPGEEP